MRAGIRTLYDITQLLESTVDARERVERALVLVRDLVPYERCAVLVAHLGSEPQIVVVPELPPDERDLVASTLVDLFTKLVGSHTRVSEGDTSGEHLAVPLVGLDQVIGLLFVSASKGKYTVRHLRSLSVVAAKLAAYFTNAHARTELSELGRKCDEARHAAEAAHRTRDELLVLVSHELKAPLGSIADSVQTLRAAGDEGTRARALDEIEREVRAEIKLVDDIIDLASVRSATLRLDLRLVEPARLIESSLEGLQLEAERRSVRLSPELDGLAASVVADPDRVRQAISALVATAITLAPTGGEVTIRLVDAADRVRIEVRPGGDGLDADTLSHVFDLSGASNLHVELAIAKEIVELHGGRVEATGGAPLGTLFTLTLPRAPARAAPADDRLLTGVSVLVVDRDHDLRESVRTVLDGQGASVTAVDSATHALEAIERVRPDVLLFGNLVGSDAVHGLLREAMARVYPIPAASISARRLGEGERDLVAGFQMHLTEPLEIAALIDAVARLAGRTRKRAPRLFLTGEPTSRRPT